MSHCIDCLSVPSVANSEVQCTMLELLNQLPTQNIKVVMATNPMDNLDPALLRLGCIDMKIEFPLPNEEVGSEIKFVLEATPLTFHFCCFCCPLQAQLDILRIHSFKMNLTCGIDMRKIAEVKVQIDMALSVWHMIW